MQYEIGIYPRKTMLFVIRANIACTEYIVIICITVCYNMMKQFNGWSQDLFLESQSG